MKKKELLLELKRDIFNRAELFIGDMGEFAPFGSELINDEIKPVIIYDDSEEIVSGEKLINILKESLSKNLKEKKSQACAIAYDVYLSKVNNDGEKIKFNALCLIISNDGENWEEDYYPYQVIEQECVWG